MSVRAEWDREADAAYFRLNQVPIFISEEIKPGIILDYDRAHRVVGIEILDFSKRFSSSRQAATVRRVLTDGLQAGPSASKSTQVRRSKLRGERKPTSVR